MGDMVTQAIDFSLEDEDSNKKAWASLTSLDPRYKSAEIADDEFSIGRTESCSLCIDSAVISGTHCRLFKEGDIVFIEDLSTNGTYINGDKLGKGNRLILTDACEITLVSARPAKGIEKLAYLYHYFEDHKSAAGQCGIYQDYLVREVLGSGAFATVKLAIHKKTGEKYAVKIIDKKKMQKGAKRDTIMDEVNILKKVSHPNIIGIKELFETEKELYLVLELVTGGDLYDKLVERSGFPEDETKVLFSQMLSAVQYLHDSGIAHRDLKPENILLDSKDSQIKISDFGLSRVIGEQSFMQTLCGTPQYLAPEVLTNSQYEGYGKAVDLWSLGVILYSMLCADNPFKESSSVSIFDQVKTGHFTYEDEVWTKFSDEVKHLIKMLLVVNPTERLTAAEALKHPWITATGDIKDFELATKKSVKQLNNSGKGSKLSSVVASTSTKPVASTASIATSMTSDEKSVENSASDSESDSSASARKRKATDIEQNEEDEQKPVCKYGKSCYRKNPAHFQEFCHPWKTE